ncbi:acyltransferase family protein [Clostridium fungisolvens]|uniref:Acyltransferase 3 domain-containing protein n=1 Tax=Clostridium fungisolvens TaxID=1604897 RepID=A0A6V8SGH7_9CLOT|nr:acyltransferase [Clostridium fungisolvens]GFP74248.1 hypothetical protein bsdtw1_00293 [Clostridium fungisolvens]
MKKIKYLDGIRGLAALSVVIFHFVRNFYPTLDNANINQIHTNGNIEILFATTPLNLLYNGNFAVCIFFILSGYVLSYKFFATKNDEVIVSSAFKRYFRLLIPVLFSVLLYFACIQSLPTGEKYFGNRDGFTLGKALYESFIGILFYGESTFNSALWTMSIEFIGSFIVFAFCAIFGKSNKRIIAYLLAIIIFWNSYYLAFILGMLLSDISSFDKFTIKKAIYILPLFFLSIYTSSFPTNINIKENSTIGIDLTIYSFLNYIVKGYLFWHIVGAFILIFILINVKKLQSFFSLKIFEFLGKISFSMYITHLLVIIFFSRDFFELVHKHLGYNYSALVTFVISLGLIIVISYPTYYFVDRFSVKFANILYNHFFKVNNFKFESIIRSFTSNVNKNRILLCFSFIITSLITLVFIYLVPIRFFYYSNKNISIELNSIIHKNDYYQLYYTETNSDTFSDSKVVQVPVMASTETQKIKFNLPIENISKLRIDFGSTPGVFYIKNIEVIKANKKESITLADITNYKFNQIEASKDKNYLKLMSNEQDPFIVSNNLNIKKINNTNFLNYSNIILFILCLFPSIFYILLKVQSFCFKIYIKENS